MNRRYANLCLCSIAVLAIFAPRLWALDPQKGLTQFTHRRWQAADGIGYIYSIAQTSDGYLWLDSSNGTYRFDGIRFTRLEAVSGQPGGIRAKLLGGNEGSLWIARGKNVLRYKDEKVQTFGVANGLPDGKVYTICAGEDHDVWVGTSAGIAKYSDGAWHKFGPTEGVPDGNVRAICLDSKNNLWAAIVNLAAQPQNAIVRLRPGDTRFQRMGDGEFYALKLAEAPDGKIWAAQTANAVRAFVPGSTGIRFSPPNIHVGSADLIFDRDGSLWITTLGDGLRRVRDIRSLGPVDVGQLDDTIDRFTQKEGLSSNYIECVFEGREGEIWVGTSAGLDCFRESKFTAISSLEGLPFDQNLLLQPAGSHGIMAGSTPRGFEQIEDAGKRFKDLGWSVWDEAARNTGTPGTVSCLYPDPQGGLLAGTGAGVVAIGDDGRKLGDLPGAQNLKMVLAMTRDNSGTLWVCDRDQGVWRFGTDGFEKVPEALHDPGHAVLTAHTDRMGRVWLASADKISGVGFLACYEGGRIRWYSEKDGLFPGRIFSIVSDAEGQVWFAGPGGISRFEQGHFATLTRRNGLPDDNLFSILQDDEKGFWLAGWSGLFHVEARVLEAAFASPTNRLTGELFGPDDGINGLSLGQPIMEGRSNSAKSADDKLWFPTNAGIVMVDPRHLPRNPLPPPVHIQQVLAAGKSYRASAALAFPIGTRDCEIDYIGICFSNPEKVRYRYKLDGYDEKWVEAASRREAFYSNLKPGAYEFEVQACNNDGIWNETGDSVDFAIAPAFYETSWFRVACLLPVALALWGLHRLRLAQAAARMNLRLESQLNERKRIARELHDTLLQGFIGIGLKLDAIAANLPESLSPVRDQLRKILDQSDQYLAEARRSVSELRAASLEEGEEFSRALGKAGQRLVEGTRIKFSYLVEGGRRKLAPHFENNLLRIGEEAVSNAVRHARATAIAVHLQFRDREVCLRVRDNGSGFEPPGAAAASGGHFGLIGMQERCEAMGGRMSLTSQPGQGTEIIVTVQIT